ncbi:MAG: hypothetical protein QQN41_12440 [Nitrosopumilus sp.]
MTALDNVTAIKFKNTFLIPIKSDISKLFGTDKIQFQISIKDKKIVIESPKILADMDIQNSIPGKEAINV